jgi:hypothetical protein
MQEGSAFTMDIVVSLPDIPDLPKMIDADIRMENLLIEQCSDVLVSLTQLVPDFKIATRFPDISNKSPSMDLEKRVRL